MKKTALTAAEEAHRRWLCGPRKYDLPSPGRVLVYSKGVPVLPGDGMEWETTGAGLAIDGMRYVHVRSTASWLRTPQTQLLDERALPELRALREGEANLKATERQEPGEKGTK